METEVLDTVALCTEWVELVSEADVTTETEVRGDPDPGMGVARRGFFPGRL